MTGLILNKLFIVYWVEAFVQANWKKPNVQKLPGSVVSGASVLTSVTLGDMLVTF